MQYQLSRVVAGPILHAFGRPRATGLENIPASGPALLASNNLSIIDSVYLPLMLSRPVVFPAKAEYFTAKGPVGRLWAAYLRSTNQLAMNRDDTRSATATLAPTPTPFAMFSLTESFTTNCSAVCIRSKRRTSAR